MNKLARRARWNLSRALRLFRRIAAGVMRPLPVSNLPTVGFGTVSGAVLAGQVAVITGSTQGVGLALARDLAKAGCKIVVNGRSADDVDRVAGEIRDSGGAAAGVCADISTESGAQALLDGAIAAFGRVDALINNAGVTGPVDAPTWDVGTAEWRHVLEVNLTGPFLCSKAVIRWMREHGVRGRIINVSSGAGRYAAPRLAPYVVSKFGLEGLTKCLALETGWSGPTVTAVELGSLRTRLTRPHFRWEDHEMLPPPESVVPLFIHALTAPHESIQGRILAAWRFAKDPMAETILTNPLAMFEHVRFPRLSHSGKVLSRADQAIVPLDRAENQHGMPPRARRVLDGSAHLDFSKYPEGDYQELRVILSQQLGLPGECITFGAGSAELVERAVRTFAQPGDEALATNPTWFMFQRFAAMHDVRVRMVPLSRRPDGGFSHNLETIARSIGVETRFIYLINPNNPTGNGIAKEEFLRFLDLLPRHIPVLVDEAYLEFSTNPATLWTNEIVLQTDHPVIGLRTFSKFYGLAGLRIGYAYAAPHTIRLFNRLEHPFALSSVAETAAIAALQDKEFYDGVRQSLEEERERIHRRLTEAGIGFIPSETHYMLVEFPDPPERIYKTFEDKGIFLSRGLFFGRYSIYPIARRDQNERNLEILCSL